MGIELKPCPFCGGKAELAYGAHDYNVWTVLCCNENCHASAGWADTPEEAAEEWNRRIEPKPQWIPVTERLPEQREDVIMNAFWHEKWQPLLGWYSDMHDVWHYEFGGCYHHVPVNAWMPLPEPYKEEHDD